MERSSFIVSNESPILVTGAAGFIGVRVVESLLNLGFRNLCCLVRPTSELKRLHKVLESAPPEARCQVVTGNLLAREDCLRVTNGVVLIYHLAAGTGTKSYADAFLNSVVSTRNLLEATLHHQCLKRFVSLSSFAVYTNKNNPKRGILDETCPVERKSESRAEAYCYAKVKQDELVAEYGDKFRIPYVLMRPGVVYGPGKTSLNGRIGIDTFGLFLHLGGSSPIPFTYVENCAEAIVLSGLKPGIDGEVFNVVDDDLPTSRQFLRAYKRQVRSFRSIYLPKYASYLLCFLWDKYSCWSGGQLPAVFTPREWHAYWKRTTYSNQKIKQRLGWLPRVSTQNGLNRYFTFCREALKNA